MAGEGKVDVEIIYGVPCGHLGMAIWMATELSAAGDRDVALTLTPGTHDVLQVYIDGEKIYDKHAEQNQFPTLPRVKQMREVVCARLASASGGDAWPPLPEGEGKDGKMPMREGGITEVERCALP